MVMRARPLFLPMGLIVTVITLVALAFSAYVAIDNDLRTLVWSKWKGDVAYEWPGGDRNISINIQIEEKE